MLLLKGCPRCHGDLALDRDARTAFLYCVQCGHILSTAQETALRVHTTRHGLTHLAPLSSTAEERPRDLAAASVAR